MELDHQLEHGPKTGKHDIRYPLPPIARRIVLPGSYWNLGKTGGDTLTRLFDEADIRGLDTENNVATARVFMYAAAAIHRLHQYTMATQNVSDYPTIQAFRHAANNRTSMKKTLQLILSESIDIAKGESLNSKDTVQLLLPDPTGPFLPSPIKEVS